MLHFTAHFIIPLFPYNSYRINQTCCSGFCSSLGDEHRVLTALLCMYVCVVVSAFSPGVMQLFYSCSCCRRHNHKRLYSIAWRGGVVESVKRMILWLCDAFMLCIQILYWYLCFALSISQSVSQYGCGVKLYHWWYCNFFRMDPKVTQFYNLKNCFIDCTVLIFVCWLLQHNYGNLQDLVKWGNGSSHKHFVNTYIEIENRNIDIEIHVTGRKTLEI